MPDQFCSKENTSLPFGLTSSSIITAAREVMADVHSCKLDFWSSLEGGTIGMILHDIFVSRLSTICGLDKNVPNVYPDLLSADGKTGVEIKAGRRFVKGGTAAFHQGFHILCTYLHSPERFQPIWTRIDSINLNELNWDALNRCRGRKETRHLDRRHLPVKVLRQATSHFKLWFYDVEPYARSEMLEKFAPPIM